MRRCIMLGGWVHQGRRYPLVGMTAAIVVSFLAPRVKVFLMAKEIAQDPRVRRGERLAAPDEPMTATYQPMNFNWPDDGGSARSPVLT